MTNPTELQQVLLPLLRRRLSDAKLALDEFESRLGDGVVDDLALGKLARAVFLSGLNVKQVQADPAVIRDEDFIYQRAVNLVLTNNEV